MIGFIRKIGGYLGVRVGSSGGGYSGEGRRRRAPAVARKAAATTKGGDGGGKRRRRARGDDGLGAATTTTNVLGASGRMGAVGQNFTSGGLYSQSNGPGSCYDPGLMPL